MGAFYSKAETNKKVAILGLDAAGKVTIMKQINADWLHIPEIPRNFRQFDYSWLIKTTTLGKIDFLAWDMGGQKYDQKLMVMGYLPNIDGLIYVIDSNSRDRLVEAITWLQFVMDHMTQMKYPMPKAILIFANKQDLPFAVSVEKLAEDLNLPTKNSGIAWHIAPCVAIENRGIQEGLKWLTETLEGKTEAKDVV